MVRNTTGYLNVFYIQNHTNETHQPRSTAPRTYQNNVPSQTLERQMKLTYEQKLSKKKAADERRRMRLLEKPLNSLRKPVRFKPSYRPVRLQRPSRATKTRKPKSDINKAKEKLWQLCKQIIRKTYGNTCYTCNKMGLEGSSWQTGHFIPSSICGAYLRFDLRNLRPQCFRCNIDLSGNGSVFYRKLVHDLGQSYVDDLFRDKERTTKADIHFYNALIESYTQKLSELK